MIVSELCILCYWSKCWLCVSIMLVLLPCFCSIIWNQIWSYHLQYSMAIPPSAFFFVLTALANFGLLCLHSKFEIILSMSVEKGHGVLIMVALNLYITCGSMAIFTIVILPTRDHRRSFQFLASSSISFFRVSEFSWKRSTVSLARLLPIVSLLLLFAWDYLGGYYE